MELLMGYMQQGLDFIIPMVILLGLLIFVHEMGHFLVAKYYGVRVEVFSLGFGKALFQFRYGDTDYKLSVIPLGGYVKMFGDNPSDSDEVPEDLRAVSFLHKPVGQRIAIVLAGPLMNFFFAIVLYAMVAMVGESFPKAIVGDVPSTSAAYDAGFQAGDAIHMVGDQKVQLWREVHEKVEATEGEATASDIEKSGLLRFQVKGLDGQIRDVLAKTEVIDNPNIISNDEKVGHIEGLSPLAESVQVAVKPGSLADKAGIQDLDQIVSINEHELRYFYELPHFLSQLKAGTKSLALKVKRTKDAKDQNPETLDVSIALESKKKVTLESLGLDRTNLYLADVIPDTPAYKSGLRRGDHITSINGVALSQWSDLVEQVRTFDPEKNKNLQVSVLRKSDSGEARETKSFSIAPELNSQTQPTGEKKSVFTLGVVRAATFVEPPTTLIRTWNPFHGNMERHNGHAFLHQIHFTFSGAIGSKSSVPSCSGGADFNWTGGQQKLQDRVGGVFKNYGFNFN